MSNKPYKLIPLLEYNEMILNTRADVYPSKNGLACPVCGVELSDLNSKIVLNSPKQGIGYREVECVCGYRGTRFVG